MVFLSRTVRASFQNISRNKVLSMAILMVMTIALFVFQLTIATNLITDSAIAIVHKQIDLAVDLRPGAQDFQIQTVISALKKLDSVRDAIYVDKTTALENFRQHHAEIAGFLDEYGIENPLPNTIFILTNSPASHTAILNFLEQPIYSSIVDTSTSADKIKARTRTNRLVEIVDAVRQFATTFTILLLALGIFTIWNTIRVVMHARKEEREIMTLVGAAPRFMKAPYFWEGLWFGIGSAVLATILSGVAFKVIAGRIAGYLSSETMIFTSWWVNLFPKTALNLSDFFNANWFVILLLTIALGSVCGIVSAWFGVIGKEKL
ncbi:MAG: permease-like cell division protein FtsX [Patescibacteria group bacterium]|nr:permease-like cell division protein FtsX [Patescibacteria group bacterium]